MTASEKQLKKQKIICDIRQKMLDLKSFYPDTALELSIHVASNAKTPGNIKVKITESL